MATRVVPRKHPNLKRQEKCKLQTSNDHARLGKRKVRRREKLLTGRNGREAATRRVLTRRISGNMYADERKMTKTKKEQRKCSSDKFNGHKPEEACPVGYDLPRNQEMPETRKGCCLSLLASCEPIRQPSWKPRLALSFDDCH